MRSFVLALKEMWHLVQFITVAFCVAVFVIETRLLVRRAKYWPLAADDYAIASLMVAALLLEQPWVLVIGWALALGSLYATLFSRLDPAYQGTKKWRILVGAMAWCGVGLGSTLWVATSST